MDSFEFSHNHMRKILLLFPFLEKRNWGTQGLVPCLKSHSSQVAMLELEQSQYGDFKASRMIREYARESCAWSGKDEKCSFGRQFSSIIFSSSLSLFIFSWFKGVCIPIIFHLRNHTPFLLYCLFEGEVTGLL